MILHKLRLVNKGQRGFTLVELLIVIALTGVLTASVAVGISQVFMGNSLGNNRLTAINNVRNAGDWISQDARMVKTPTLGMSSGFPLQLDWQDNDHDGGATHTVIYSITSGELTRAYDGGTAIIVARSISSISSTFGNDVLTLTVTATVGAGSQKATETRIYEIRRRNRVQ